MKGKVKNNWCARHRNVKFIVAVVPRLPWPPAGRKEAAELTTYPRVRKLRRCVRYEHVQLISLAHCNVLSPFLSALSLSLFCTLALSLCLIRSLWLINSQLCLQWLKHEVCAYVSLCVCVSSLQAAPPLFSSLDNFSSGFSFGRPAPKAMCSAYASTVWVNAGLVYTGAERLFYFRWDLLWTFVLLFLWWTHCKYRRGRF